MGILTRSAEIRRWIGRGFLRRAAFTLFLLSPHAVAQQNLEFQVKAAFLLNFTKFIEWPPAAFEDAQSPIAVCILGDDPFGAVLDQLVEGEVVNGRKLVVQRIRRAPPAKSCQVLYVARSEKEVSRTLSALGPGVLTVGEGEAFLREGGIVAFVLENRRVRFEISRTAAVNASLALSSRLLNVAKLVEK